MAYSNAIFYLDLYGGGAGDGVRATITAVTASNPSGSITRMTKTAHGLVNGAVVTTSLFTTWLNGDWKIENVTTDTFDLVGAVWQATADTSGSVVPFGGSSWADAWTTISSGVTAARIAPGDTIRISKTPDPVSIGSASWTDNTLSTGGFPATKSITGAANNGSGLIRITSNSHGFSDNDVIQIMSIGGTIEARGAWIISGVTTNTFDLVGSTFVTTYTSGGTAQKINSKAVVLSTAQNVNVERCKTAWTNGVDGTASLYTTDHKDGGVCVRITMDASTTANALQGYKATGTLDLSAYQKISFWFKNSSAVTNATTYTIRLCSDTAGVTAVDTFVIPAIPSTARWVPLTIARNGGGNLGSSIQSIAIYSAATVPTGGSTIDIDNITASTASGLNLRSLISKNGSAQGGTEGFYGIQSINGKVVLLDNDTNTLSNAGRGYTGTTETVTTYFREGFKTTLVSTFSTAVNTLNDSGTLGNLISYEFGYEVGTSNQNGETFFDGLNGNGYGIYFSSKTYNSLNYCSAIRYYNGVYLLTSNFNSLLRISNTNNNTGNGFYINGSHNNTFSNIVNSNNNTSQGISLTNANHNRFLEVTNTNNNTSNGTYFSSSSDSFFSVISNSNNNSSYGLYFGYSGNNIIKTVSTDNNGSSIYNDGGVNYIRNASLSDSTEFASSVGCKGIVWSYDHDQTAANHWGFSYGATFNWQTSIKHDTEIGSWKTSVTNAERHNSNKVVLKIAEVAGTQSTNLIVKAWIKKDHATNIASRLVCYADTALNITEQAATKASDTDWEELTITVNSSHANPVFSIFLETWYVAGSSNSYVGKITVT